jgi:Cyclic nucleotide-binding domain
LSQSNAHLQEHYFRHKSKQAAHFRCPGVSGLGRRSAENCAVQKEGNDLFPGRCLQERDVHPKGQRKALGLSNAGKEAVVAILGPGDFLGEGALAGQPKRIAAAKTVAAVTLLVIDKKEMFRVLHAEHALADRFITYMLERNIRVEADLVDQLFNSSEKRLARTLQHPFG